MELLNMDTIIDICPYCMQDMEIKTRTCTDAEKLKFGIIIDKILECKKCKNIWVNSYQQGKFLKLDS